MSDNIDYPFELPKAVKAEFERHALREPWDDDRMDTLFDQPHHIRALDGWGRMFREFLYFYEEAMANFWELDEDGDADKQIGIVRHIEKSLHDLCEKHERLILWASLSWPHDSFLIQHFGEERPTNGVEGKGAMHVVEKQAAQQTPASE